MTTAAEEKWISGSYGDDELCAIAGMPHSTLIRHITEGALQPMDDRRGRGHRRRWGPMAVRRAIVITAMQRAGLPRKVAAKISYAVRAEWVLYWEFEYRELENKTPVDYFVEIMNGDLVFRYTRRDKKFSQPRLIGRLINEGNDFEPTWDWREEEIWTRDAAGGSYYYPKWQEPFINEQGVITFWSEDFFEGQPDHLRVAFMDEIENGGRFAAYDRPGRNKFTITHQLCSEEFREFEIDSTVTEDEAVAVYADFETKLTINLTKPLREALERVHSGEFRRQSVRIIAASHEDDDE